MICNPNQTMKQRNVRSDNAANLLVPKQELEEFIRACAPRYSEARFQHVAGWIYDASIDIAEFLGANRFAACSVSRN